MTTATARKTDVEIFLGEILTALKHVTPQKKSFVLDTAHFSPAERVRLADLLGKGEVSIQAEENRATQMTETVLTGVWHGIKRDEDNRIVADTVEIGAIPHIVRTINLAGAAQPAPLPVPANEGVMNAPAVLAEVTAAIHDWRPGAANHVINFTLMPMTADDIILVSRCLGQAPLHIVAKSYGTCRVISTAVRHVWSVQYRNSIGKIILDTLEIGDVPLSVQAAREDFEDSAKRLADIIAGNPA